MLNSAFAGFDGQLAPGYPSMSHRRPIGTTVLIASMLVLYLRQRHLVQSERSRLALIYIVY